MKTNTQMTTALVATGLLIGGLLVGVLYGRQRWVKGTEKMRSELESGRVAVDPKMFRVQELDALPAPVKRYFQRALRDGQPIIAAANVAHQGSFDMGESKPNWKPFTSNQRVITERPGFDWDAKVMLLPGLPVFIHDAYVAGRGRLQASVLGLFSMADMVDSLDLRRGELMRFFAEAAWYPTALLPSQGVQWSAIDEHAAEATITDGDVSLTMLFRFNSEGLIDTVRSQSCARTVGGVTTYAPWQCRLWDYEFRDGINVPLQGEAAYVLHGEAKPYFHGQITSIAFEFAH